MMKNLFKSLAAFQQEMPILHKATQGYGYSYTELSDIIKTINPLLKKHGLGFTQPIDGEELTTILFHWESGETLESKTIVPKVALKGMNDYQSFGSGITYYRRYALSSMLGLVTDKDSDASGEQVKPQAPAKPKAKSDFKPQGYENAIKAVLSGKMTAKAIVDAYNVTPEQVKQLNEAEAMKGGANE